VAYYGNRGLSVRVKKNINNDAEKMGIDIKAAMNVLINKSWSLERALLPRPAAYKAAALLG
jgi:hypothetical protein